MAKVKESLSGEGEAELYREVLTCGNSIHTTLIDPSNVDGNIGTEWEARVSEEAIVARSPVHWRISWRYDHNKFRCVISVKYVPVIS